MSRKQHKIEREKKSDCIMYKIIVQYSYYNHTYTSYKPIKKKSCANNDANSFPKET